MSLILQLTTQNQQIAAHCNGITLATTPASHIPNRAEILANPYEHGATLWAALGGDTLRQQLDNQPDALLYLDIAADDPADAVPWECALLEPKLFAVHRYALLRLVDRPAQLDPTPKPLRLLALGADALVDKHGQPRDTYRLDILQEMRQIERAIARCGQDISAVRLAPTPAALRRALGSSQCTLLHLSCHGSIITTSDGPRAVLHLEDDNGGPEMVWGSDLISAARLADLRLVLLSACRMGQNEGDGYGRLVRTMVQQGIPAAIGMQGLFPDDLSDDLAAALYNGLLQGRTLGDALMMARQALGKVETAVALPICYVARGGDAPLPLQPGRPSRQRLDLSQNCQLPTGVQLPHPFVGRNAELHELAKIAQHTSVITVIGTGGMGKTALAAAFARRFALRYDDGVWGYSFAVGDVDAGAFRRDLLRHLLGDELADKTAEQQERTILDTLRDQDLLLLLDNYESVQQALENPAHPHHAAAQSVHRLLARVASNGGQMLLTSRQQPAGLKGERVFPSRDQLLQGVDERAAAELFFDNSPRAKEKRREPEIQELARAVGRVTAGHPLAIALLGSEYDKRHVAAAAFLDNWEAGLRAARSRGLDDHHATFATAFDRSYLALSQPQQQRLNALSLIPFPFFAQGAAHLWEVAGEDGELTATREMLQELVDRSLVEIGSHDRDGMPSIWQFQPAVRQEVASRLTAAEQTAGRRQLALYANWLGRITYGEIHREGKTALVHHIRPILDALVELAADLPDESDRLWHWRRVGWLLNALGRSKDAYALLVPLLPAADALAEAASLRSSLRYEIANLEVTRGDLDKALSLYQESLAGYEQIGDIQGKAASLSMMAQVYLTRGDLDKALSLYQESLASLEQIGDIQGKAASLHNMAQVYLTRGDLDKALSLYQESLALKEQIGDIKGKAASLHNLAHLYIEVGQREKAEELLAESLRLNQFLSQPEGIAFVNLTLGRLRHEDNNLEIAQQHYMEALRHFRQLGMAQESNQVESLLASLSSPQVDSSNGDDLEGLLAQLPPEERAQAEAQLRQMEQQVAAMSEAEKSQLAVAGRLHRAVQQAQAAAERQLWPAAISYQQDAIAHARTLAQQTGAREAAVQLSVLLFNLAGYYQQANRHHEAVACYEEVVALDEQTDHEDLASDRQALAHARQLAASAAAAPATAAPPPFPIPPDLADWVAQLPPAERATLAQMGVEQREELWQQVRAFAALSAEEQAALAHRAHFAQVEASLLEQLDQLWQALHARQLDNTQQAATADSVTEAAAAVASDEALGQQRHPLAALLHCMAAHLRGRPLPPIPTAYAPHWAEWQKP